jgi:hypothetical protein
MYRLASLFGNANFGTGGSNMADDIIIRAVRLNAMAKEDQGTIFILLICGGFRRNDSRTGFGNLVRRGKENHTRQS